jgi:hypothetical protein
MNNYNTFLKIALVLLLLAIATGSTIMNYNTGNRNRLETLQWRCKQNTRNKINDCEEFLIKYPPPQEITNGENFKNYIKEQLEKYKTENGTMEPLVRTGKDINDFTKDRWGQELSISVNNNDLNEPNFRIISAGEDGQFQTEDDISNSANKTIPFKHSRSESITGLLSFLFPIPLYAASIIILFWQSNMLKCGTNIFIISIMLLVLSPCLVPLPGIGFVIYGALSGIIAGIFLTIGSDIKRMKKNNG